MMSTLRVTKRNGELEPVQFEKVTNRIKYLCLGVLADGTRVGDTLNDVCHTTVAQMVISKITDKITTSQLDAEAARFCASKAKDSFQYGVLGGRILASNLQKNTIRSFSKTMQLLYENKTPSGDFYPLLDRTFYKFVSRNGLKLDNMIDHARDFRFDYFGFMTLEGGKDKPGYFQRRHDSALEVSETPQHLYMRVAVCLHINDYRPIDEVLSSIKGTYDALSLGMYTHASPTMYNAGTHYQQLSSCYLLGISDTMDDNSAAEEEDGSIPACWTACARISKRAGGIGIGIQPIRSRGSLIAGTGGHSDGLVPLAKVFNNIACYVNQGGRRPGAIALYEEPWCADIYGFLDLKKNTGIEEERARDLFYALWIPDLFMKRLIESIESKTDVKWSLMCPHECPGLYDTYGTEFERIYEKYEKEGKYRKQVNIMDLWEAILDSQKETGGPYMLYKDHINNKNAQSNLGVIRNSNLCAEIVEYSDDQEYAVCNLASIALPAFVYEGESESEGEREPRPVFDFRGLYDICKVAYRNLDNVIDINQYPIRKCRRSNLRHRPTGLGVQGLGDVFLLMGLPYEDTVDIERKSTKINPEARLLNLRIAEVMYYACVEASMELAQSREASMRHINELYRNGLLEFSEDGLDIIKDTGLTDSDKAMISHMRPIRQELDRESHYGSYSSFLGSPASEGLLQYHMWGKEPSDTKGWADFMNWEELVEKVKIHGLRGSLFRADMPTASTSHILGNVESTEAYKYAIYTRRITAGEFVVVNKHLHRELSALGLWTPEVQRQIILDRGSVQHIKDLDIKIKDKYRTAFEMSKKTIQIMACDSGAFTDQAKSTNYFITHPNSKKLTNIHIGAWKMGLKTGMYYLRREPNKHPVQFTADGGLTVVEQAHKDAECISCSA